ncbi:hypothetical protein FSP39_002724 [Pinctada imbricata]|uniref:MACPF domain-containing protein n=1 Tax=Pinctada imbricata TaxID=66713 RepID=A0AA88YQC6_PINIB|nr:hypothetical protein FSP39_002724 [Pinctada imbricata]
MKLLPLLLHLVFSVYAVDCSLCQIGDGQNNTLSLDVYPGSGWDNLVNENRGRVFDVNYSKCQITEDGKYFIPDGIYLTPLKSSEVEIYSDIIRNWQNYTSDIAASINADATIDTEGLSINGKFSFEYQNIKLKQIQDDAATMKVKARYTLYKVAMQPDPPLDTKFMDRVKKIAHHIQFDRKRSARYEAQLLVRDFGTHVVTSVDAGAAIVKVDHVKRSSVDESSNNLAMIALAARSELFGVFGDVKIDPQTVTAYQAAKTKSTIRTYGGPKFRPMNFSINDWIDGIEDDLVALDRSGDSLHFMITQESIPELPLDVVSETANYVRSAISSYYKHNAYKGCTDRDAPNFNFRANVDDGSCNFNLTGMTFGGLFQNCSVIGPYYGICDELESKNPLTGDFSCPSGYSVVPLYNGEVSKTTEQKQCSSFMIFWEHCKSSSATTVAQYQSYWCAQEGNEQSTDAYMFGGVFTDVIENSLTLQKACPPYFHTIAIAENIKVCVSGDFEAEKYAVPFSGFYSCQHSNPLATSAGVSNNKKKACSAGFNSYLAAEVDECDISYCMIGASYTNRKITPVRNPPFFRKPNEVNSSVEYFVANDGQSWTRIYTVDNSFHGFNTTNASLITDSGDTLDVSVLLKERQNDLGLTSLPSSDNIASLESTDMETPKRREKQGNRPSVTQIDHGEVALVVGVSSAITLLVILIISVLILSVKSKRSKPFKYYHMEKDEKEKC